MPRTIERTAEKCTREQLGFYRGRDPPFVFAAINIAGFAVTTVDWMNRRDERFRTNRIFGDFRGDKIFARWNFFWRLLFEESFLRMMDGMM